MRHNKHQQNVGAIPTRSSSADANIQSILALGELAPACLTSTTLSETVVWEAEGKGAFLRDRQTLTGGVSKIGTSDKTDTVKRKLNSCLKPRDSRQDTPLVLSHQESALQIGEFASHKVTTAMYHSSIGVQAEPKSVAKFVDWKLWNL